MKPLNTQVTAHFTTDILNELPKPPCPEATRESRYFAFKRISISRGPDPVPDVKGPAPPPEELPLPVVVRRQRQRHNPSQIIEGCDGLTEQELPFNLRYESPKRKFGSGFEINFAHQASGVDWLSTKCKSVPTVFKLLHALTVYMYDKTVGCLK
eukprot:GHVU01100672.1.p1 GENE.GHVU01100672.1~~GHVU01100672.1.p1  ORF type:complete len:154 (-),score=15.00 GHVU01100672.1:106-567(-)